VASLEAGTAVGTVPEILLGVGIGREGRHCAPCTAPPREKQATGPERRVHSGPVKIYFALI